VSEVESGAEHTELPLIGLNVCLKRSSIYRLVSGLIGKSYLADFAHHILQDFHAINQPGQFFIAYFVTRGVSGIDIGAAQQFEAALRKSSISRPCLDQRWRDPFGLGSQEIEFVRLWAVKRQNRRAIQMNEPPLPS
jgi:hypothetical protein